MARSRATARHAGSSFERLIADTLATHIDDRIDRRPKMGSKDRGDIGGVRLSPALRGGRVVIECKSMCTLHLGEWAGEAETERGNDDAIAGLIAHKRHGKAAGLDQWVTMQVRDLVALLTGERPE